MATIARASGPAVWLGCEQIAREDLIFQLDSSQIAELEQAAGLVRSTGLKLEHVTRAAFSFAALAPAFDHIRRELERGRGFVHIRGIPATQHSAEELGALFYAIGTHLGIGVAQSAAGDRLGHVIDRGARDRYYTAGGPIEFHVDPVDVVGLLCLCPALEGGRSRIASAPAIHNLILEERPDLLEVLYRGFHCSRRGHGEPATHKRVPVYAAGQSAMESYLLPLTIRQAEEEGYPLSDQDRETLGYLQDVASRPGVHLDMDLQPGDIQLLNNRVIFHSRTDYRDHPDPDLKRHLLRLWLMMPDWPDRPEALRLHNRTDRAGGGVKSV